jgi:hypothetical protein
MADKDWKGPSGSDSYAGDYLPGRADGRAADGGYEIPDDVPLYKGTDAQQEVEAEQRKQRGS